MSVVIVSTGLCKNATPFLSQPQFRKATPNMILTLMSIQEALQGAMSAGLEQNFHSCGLVLGSSHGELSITLSFLKALIQDHIARPLLFQNSLHNSTGGFAAVQLRLTGPMLTVSNRYFTGEDAIDMGLLLLQERQCEFCLITGVDAAAPDLVPGVNVLPEGYGQGAGSVLLARQENVGDGFRKLQNLRYERKPTRTASIIPNGFYDSNAIEIWIESLRSRPSQGGELQLEKPDGSSAVIQWT